MPWSYSLQMVLRNCGRENSTDGMVWLIISVGIGTDSSWPETTSCLIGFFVSYRESVRSDTVQDPDPDPGGEKCPTKIEKINESGSETMILKKILISVFNNSLQYCGPGYLWTPSFCQIRICIIDPGHISGPGSGSGSSHQAHDQLRPASLSTIILNFEVDSPRY